MWGGVGRLVKWAIFVGCRARTFFCLLTLNANLSAISGGKLPHRATRQERGFYRAIWVSLPFVLAILNLNSEPDYTHTMNHES